MPALLLPLVLSLSSPSAGADAPATAAPATARPIRKRPLRKRLRKPKPKPKPEPSEPPPQDEPDAAPSGELKLVTRADSSQWWYAFDVTPSTQALAKIELRHAGDAAWIRAESKTGYFALEDNQSGPFLLPFSVRVTDTGGVVYTATNVVTSLTPGEAHGTGIVLGSQAEPDEPEQSPPPSQQPPPQTTPGAVTTQPQSGEYWYAFTVSGVPNAITKIELRPANVNFWRAATRHASHWSLLHNNGEPLTLPLSLRVTDSAGNTYTAIDAITSFNAGQVFQLSFVVNAAP